MTTTDIAALRNQISRYRVLSTPLGRDRTIEYLQAGHADSPVTHVMLHGIGSSSASWLAQLEAAALHSGRTPCRVLAWNAPGYGRSSPLGPDTPRAADYARRLWLWLDTMQVDAPFVLVGQSMGCLIAAAAAAQQPKRIRRLVLFAPARGYGRASREERERRRDERLAALRELGPSGLAQRRAASMLSPNAEPALVEYVRDIMQRINPAGYAQATHMLSMGDIDSDLARSSAPLVVASGSADTITSQASCSDIAARAGVKWVDMGPVGHGCPLEAPVLANTLLNLAKSVRQA